ncbi:MAG: hypothetical protein J6S85_01785 [Methanobrevibacter sp.]|nr:hypothetical protein [Methanobrevibacter sp.]MBO7712266.1 hypothetical protein [Methanobrevibacter sp.]
MIDKKAIEAVENAVFYEHQNIVKKYGAIYHSEHEGYAVLLEEVEEADDALDLLKTKLQDMWNYIKINMNDRTTVYQAQQAAIGLAEEAIQCAAVCERFLNTLSKENEKK